MKSFIRIAGLAASLTLAAACSAQDQTPDASIPQDAGQATEAPPSLNGAERPSVRASMVAAANPYAVEAGLEALRAGGSAVDAAIAVQTVLGLVEPQSSGIGGGAFLVHYEAATGALTVYDGRETAPAGATPDMMIENGAPLPFLVAWTSGRAVGAPGAIAMLRMAHEEHGALPWAEGFGFAANLAETGFEVSPRLSDLLGRIAAIGPIDERPATRDYFFDADGAPWPGGHRLANPDYAATMRAVGADWRAFYEGDIAAAIVAAAREEPFPGTLTLSDLAGYAPVRREAVCRVYRVWRVCGAPPPASGGVAVNAILGLLEPYDMTATGPGTAEGWRRFIEASRLAYADRDLYVGDADFVPVPVGGMLDRDYLAARAALIDRADAMPRAEAGIPPGAPGFAGDTTGEAPGTSHFVVVDAAGNVVSMTTTVEAAFGSQRMAAGFLLNNQMTDFAFSPFDADGRPAANAVAPGKRPRSSMSPTIVLDEDGEFLLATGSPGGNSIIGYTARTLIAMLDWGMSPAEAAAQPNVVARGDTVNIEAGFDAEILAELEAMGFTVAANRGENSGIHIVRRTPDGSLEGAADPRREGVALGMRSEQ